MHTLCEITIRQGFQSEKALTLLLSLLKVGGPQCWTHHQGSEDFNRLMDKLCVEFAGTQDKDKFELCEVLRTVILSFPKTNFDEESWLPALQLGLRDCLFSRLTKEQRDPALKLLAAVVETSDFDWCLATLESDK